MKIAIVHSRYSSGSSSGENIVVKNHVDLLENMGHKVLYCEVSTPENPNSLIFFLRSALNVCLGRFGNNPLPAITRFQPDYIFLHNIFPNISESWIKKCEFPIVRFVHNFRTLCANGTFYRDSKPCQRCLESTAWNSMKYKCYRSSRLATLPLFVSILRTKYFKRPLIFRPVITFALNSEVAKIIAIGERSNQKIRVLSNFSQSQRMEEIRFPELGQKWVIVSRLELGKGIEPLLDIFPSGQSIDIIGTGSQISVLASKYRNMENIRFLGEFSQEDIKGRLSSYRGGIFPSQLIEGSPMVLLDFLEASLPIVGIVNNFKIPGLMADISLSWADQDLERKLANILNRFEDSDFRQIFQRLAKHKYENSFSAQAWHLKLLEYLDGTGESEK